jgi:GR25 family glycosyltransferase involved in LPS biosynthesis
VDDHVLVLEDDALLSPALANFLNDPSWLPDDADLVHLGAADNRCFVQGLGRAARDRTLYRSVRCTGAEAYIITRRCAAYLARNLTSIDREFDQILFGGGRPELKIYKVLPALCTQDRVGIKSTIERSRPRKEDAEAMRRNRRLAHLRIRIAGLTRLARRKAVDYR